MNKDKQSFIIERFNMARKKDPLITFMMSLGVFILMVLLIILAIRLWQVQAFGIHQPVNLR